tara:strand:- start:1691 stop:2653 length:963 start_codon:yes stop_codon:yes gene_type:complete
MYLFVAFAPARSHHQHESDIVCVGHSCAAYVQASLNKHIDAAENIDRHLRDRSWEACNKTLVESEMRAAPAGDALARASAFLRGCSSTRAWTRWDALGYFEQTWLPEPGRCARMRRFGPSVEQRDGGKTICEQGDGAAVPPLGAPGDCLVVSVGLNNDTDFEEALHSAHPACRIDGIDGTLDAAKSARLAQAAPFVRLAGRAMFGIASWKPYAAQRVRLLKIDCEGCEFDALPEWVQHVCTDAIVVEVHRMHFMRQGREDTALADPHRRRVERTHALFAALAKAGFVVVYLEPNVGYPTACTEYTLVRTTPCNGGENRRV